VIGFYMIIPHAASFSRISGKPDGAKRRWRRPYRQNPFSLTGVNAGACQSGLNCHFCTIKKEMKRLSTILLFCLSTIYAIAQSSPPVDSLPFELYLTQIALTETLLEMGEIADAKATLSKTDPARRGWEWQYLNAALDRSGATLKEHGASVSYVTFSPDGRWMASGRSRRHERRGGSD
jgi:hypothetical protein